MKKRLLLLLCLIATAGSAALAGVLKQGTFKNGGTWKITPDGELYVDAEVIPDYKETSSSGLNAVVSLEDFGYRTVAYDTPLVTNSPWSSYSICLKSITFSSKVKHIGDYAFAGLYMVQSVDFETGTDNVEIGKNAFRGCFNMRDFEFSRVTVIGEGAFTYCYNLQSSTFPRLTSIGEGAFHKCLRLGNIYLSGNTMVKGLNNMVECPYAITFYITGDNEPRQCIALERQYVVNPNLWSAYQSSYSNMLIRAGNKDWYFEQRSSGGYLTINGFYRGIPDYSDETQQPWYLLRDKIRFVNMDNIATYGGKIGKNAFKGCSNLEGFDILSEFYALEIGESAFEGCTKLGTYGFRDINVVTSIGKKAFANTSLSSINLNNAKTIGDNAFDGSTIHKVTFGDNLTSIGQYAFRECFKNGGDIYVYKNSPDNTASNAFQGANLNETYLHVNADYIASYQQTAPWSSFMMEKEVTFPAGGDFGIGYGKWQLTSDGTLTISTTLTPYDKKIPDYENISDQPWYQYREFINKIVLSNDITQVGKNAFALEQTGISQIKSIEAPAVTVIGNNAFKNNEVLRSFTSEKVQTIGDYAFAGCTNIENYKFGSDLKTIGDHAFDGCKNVDVLALTAANPPDVTAETFEGMGKPEGAQGTRRRAGASGLKSITLDVPEEYMTKYLANIYWRLFAFYTGEHGEVVKSGKYYDGLWVIYSDGTLIASSNTSEGDIDGFYYDTTVKRVEFLGNATELNWTGFGANDLPNVEEIILSPAMTKLGNEAFKGLSKLKSINLEGVESIGSETFKGCSSLTKADMGAVKEIGDRAFEGCTSLTDVTLYGKGGKIGYYTFKDCTSLKSIDMSGINYAASGVFEGCSALESVIFRGQALQVYSNMFKNCTALKSLDVSDDCWSINASSLAGTGISRIYSASPKPPTINETAFGDRPLTSITAYVPADYMNAYRKAPVWRNMNFAVDERYGEPQLPTGGSVGEKGTWELDELGALTIDCEGRMPASDQYFGADAANNRSWYSTFDRWAAFIENVRYTDGVTYIPQNVTDGEAEEGTYHSMKTVEIGCNVDTIRENAMRYTGLTDVYCFSPEPPFIVTSEENGTFDKAAILANGTTLHVVDFQGTLEKYKNSYRWNWFPKIVADLPTRKPGTIMVEKVNVSSPTGTWLSVRSSELGSTNVQLEASVYPANAANTALVWTSEDESVATVDANGLVTILGYPDMMEVGITATAADGSNRKGTVSLRIVNPENDWGSVLCEGMDVDRKTITIMKSQAPATITVKLEPANSTANIEFDVVDNSLIQVEAEYDNASGRRTGVFHISAPDPMMMPEIRTGSTQIHFYTHYYDEATLGVNYPEVWVNVNVIEDVRFTEETVQKVPVTYAVTSLDGGTCTVYGEWVDGHDENGTWVDGGYNTAIDQSTTGLVTVPNKARNYYVTGVDGSAFADCSQLEQIEFESGIKFIGNSAFTGCSNLREVLLPESIEAFGYSCFSNLPSLKDVHILATTPPAGGGIYVGNPWSWPAIGDSYAFSGLTGATLHVPAGCSEAYNISPWNVWFSTITEDAADGIEGVDGDNGHDRLDGLNGAWFDLSGRKLAERPAKPGLYINGGKKIVIK